LGLLRALIATISGSQIILHIYRSVISHNNILLDWSLRRTYVLVKAFALLTATVAFNSSNRELKLAGYRGFDLPPKATEIAEWFKTLRDRLEEKHKEL
ncbi:hypothetical protein KR084_005179, partial [Drosophila pseudotakahashii]